VLPHAEIVVRAPHRNLGADAVVIGAREPAAAPLQIGEHPVPPLGAQRIETLSEDALAIHQRATDLSKNLRGDWLHRALRQVCGALLPQGQGPCSLMVSLKSSPSERKGGVAPSIAFRNTSRSACCAPLSVVKIVVCGGNSAP